MKHPLIFSLVLLVLGCKLSSDSKPDGAQVDSTGLNKKTIEKTSISPDLVAFLRDPLDVEEFKTTKGQSLASIVNESEYHFNPGIQNSVFYHYTTFPNDSLWTAISPVSMIVFKYGRNKHVWHDDSEILIEFTATGKDSALKKANLVGLTAEELVVKFGPYQDNFANKHIYSHENMVLVLALENGKVKWFTYIKLNTETIDRILIQQILRSKLHLDR